MTDAAPDQQKQAKVGPGETVRGRLQPYLVPGLISIIGVLLAAWLTFATVSFGSRIDDLRESLRDTKEDARRDQGALERRLDRIEERLTHQERIRMGD